MRSSRRGRPPRGGCPARRGDSSVGSLRRLPRKVGRFEEKCKKFRLTAMPRRTASSGWNARGRGRVRLPWQYRRLVEPGAMET
jgi:hypothetical protein